MPKFITVTGWGHEMLINVDEISTIHEMSEGEGCLIKTKKKIFGFTLAKLKGLYVENSIENIKEQLSK